MRNYDIEADVGPVTWPAAITAALLVLEEHCVTVEGHFGHDKDQHLYYGTVQLGGGRSTEEAHDEILASLKKRMPDVILITRWRCTDELPWDEEHGELP